ncbi:MAG: ATP-dependent Clp protease proteolytic subunit [Anaerostipes faecalis]|nr:MULTISPECIES: ATP-dependent Clp protease proteolytic subunit [Anaerostipes]MCI5624049.1 ATP-dependent Clp protease proteolytic subunit [Anaerostipes sp.]MDY2726029.1 ATP-dependent Clp protease proteolytic subunit [Anaerostipes faecalis]
MAMDEERRNEIKDSGSTDINGIHIMTIIGEIEGHQAASQGAKTTKYEHMIPMLAKVENDDKIKGVLILINTIGGDVECGLALAELIASLSKPTVSLVLGGSHSIGVPLAVSADYSFIVKSATMMIHPVRTGGTFIGVIQSYRNIEKIQDRITRFISDHSGMNQKQVEELMLAVGEQVKDAGTILEGEEAVRYGLINQIGGMKEAFKKLSELCENKYC